MAKKAEIVYKLEMPKWHLKQKKGPSRDQAEKKGLST